MLQMAASCTKNAACFRVIAPAPPSLSKGNVQRVQILCTLAQDRILCYIPNKTANTPASRGIEN